MPTLVVVRVDGLVQTIVAISSKIIKVVERFIVFSSMNTYYPSTEEKPCRVSMDECHINLKSKVTHGEDLTYTGRGVSLMVGCDMIAIFAKSASPVVIRPFHPLIS